jgi:hypothetical protein
MTDFHLMVDRLREAYLAADRTHAGPFQFVSQVMVASGSCVLVLVLAKDDVAARSSAAKILSP